MVLLLPLPFGGLLGRLVDGFGAAAKKGFDVTWGWLAGMQADRDIRM